MKINKTIILDEFDYYEAVKDYLRKKLGIMPQDVCSVSLKTSATSKDGPVLSVIISEENV